MIFGLIAGVLTNTGIFLRWPSYKTVGVFWRIHEFELVAEALLLAYLLLG